MTNLEELKETLDRVLAEASADLEARAQSREHELAKREREIAAALELITQDAAAQAAFHQGIQEERLRVQRLIALQLEHLKAHSVSQRVLATLSRMVNADD